MADFSQPPSAFDAFPCGDDALRALPRARNINEKTFLATEYLNHFNEIVMLIDLIPDLKSILAEARQWRPKRYTAHFQESGFSARDLAIEAHRRAPASVPSHFEETVDRLNLLVAACLNRIERAVVARDRDTLREVTSRSSRDLKRMIDVVSAIISGADTRIAQGEVDSMFNVPG